jgi:hypothetical protein
VPRFVCTPLQILAFSSIGAPIALFLGEVSDYESFSCYHLYRDGRSARQWMRN